MKILALDSSGLTASVAVAEDELLIAEYTIQYKKTHSQTLIPMLDEIRKMTELDLTTLDAVAVAAGPGSFTGLRIGSASAKGLGYTLGIPLVEIPTLEGMAYSLYGSQDLICPMLDARRGQVYTGIYAFDSVTKEGGLEEEFELKVIEDQTAMAIEELTDLLNSLGRKVIFLGDGVPVYRERLAERMMVPWGVAPAHRNRQQAGAVAALACVYYRQGRFVSSKDHKPIYLRQSQAERERQEKACQQKA